MKDKKTILMIANSETASNGFLSFAERLKGREEIGLVLICHPRVRIDAVKEKSRKLDDVHVEILDFDEEERRAGDKRVKQEYHYVKDRLYVSIIKAVYNTIKTTAHNFRGLKRAKFIMRQNKPNMILLYDDNRLEFEKYFVYYAKKWGIQTIVAPICMADIEGILINPSNGFRIKKGDKLPITARIIKYINPQIDREYRDEIVFFGQPFVNIIDYLMGFRVPNPWVQGSLADIVCTAYQEQYDETVRELGRENTEGRLFLTESVEDGIIIGGYQNRKSLKNDLYGKYSLCGKTTVIIAFSERVQMWSKENDLYNKGIIVRSVLEYYDEVLVSLHPKSDVEENRFLEDYDGCHIVDEPLRNIIGAADLIIYADMSSIARWVEWLQIHKVTYLSYSMQEKWTDDMIWEFKKELADSVEMVKEEKRPELKRGIDFVEFVLERL